MSFQVRTIEENVIKKKLRQTFGGKEQSSELRILHSLLTAPRPIARRETNSGLTKPGHFLRPSRAVNFSLTWVVF